MLSAPLTVLYGVILEPKLNEVEDRADDDGDNDDNDDDEPEPLTAEDELPVEKELLELGPAVIDEPENEVLGIEEALADGALFTELPELFAEELGLVEDIAFTEELPEELPPTGAAFPLGEADELEPKLLPEFVLPEVLSEFDDKAAVLLVMEYVEEGCRVERPVELWESNELVV